MDSRLRGNDEERFARMARTHDYVVIDLSLSFPRRRESIGRNGPQKLDSAISASSGQAAILAADS